MIQHATLGIPKGTKNAISMSVAFSIDFFIITEILFKRNAKQKPFEIILHVGRVTSLQSWKGSQK